VDDSFTLPAALGTFFLKAVVLFAILTALPADGWLDRRTLAFTVVGGALLWSCVQLRWVWTRKLYYVPPPAPPAATPPATPAILPEKPATRG
jgi:ATP synthase protein I